MHDAMNAREPYAALLECPISNDDDKSPSPFKWCFHGCLSPQRPAFVCSFSASLGNARHLSACLDRQPFLIYYTTPRMLAERRIPRKKAIGP